VTAPIYDALVRMAQDFFDMVLMRGNLARWMAVPLPCAMQIWAGKKVTKYDGGPA
jgi:hypothetical protein